MQKKTNDPTRYQAIANEVARYANEENFSSRRGVLRMDDHPEVVAYYDNDPRPEDMNGGEGPRAELVRAIVEDVALLGVPILAATSYPKAGKLAGYTVAFLVASEHAETLDEACIRQLHGGDTYAYVCEKILDQSLSEREAGALFAQCFAGVRDALKRATNVDLDRITNEERAARDVAVATLADAEQRLLNAWSDRWALERGVEDGIADQLFATMSSAIEGR